MPLNRHTAGPLQLLQLPQMDLQHYNNPSLYSNGAHLDQGAPAFQDGERSLRSHPAWTEPPSRPSHYGQYAHQYPPPGSGPDPSGSCGGAPPSPISPAPQPYSNYPQYSSSYPSVTSHSAPHQSYARQSVSPYDHPSHHSADGSPPEHPRPYHQTFSDRQALSSFDRGNGMHERIPSYERPHSLYHDGWAGGERSWQDRDGSAGRDFGMPTPAYVSPPIGVYATPDGYFAPRGAQGRTGYENGSPRESDGSYDGADNDKADSTTPFISKLAHLLAHPEYSPHIRWNAEGSAIIFAHGSPELLDIFSRFFRHSNCHSFVRQLNIYGFTRLTTLDLLCAIESAPHPEANHGSDYAAFAHPLFYRGSHCRLGLLKPKPVKSKKSQSTSSPYAREEYVVSTVKGDRSSLGSVRHDL